MERMELDFPVELLEPSAVPARPHDGCFAGASRRRRRSRLPRCALFLHLDGRKQHERIVRPALPLEDKPTLLKLLQLDLETHPPSAAILSLELHAHSAAPYRAQHGLFLPQAPEPGRLEVLLARLRKLLGEERVGSMELKDDHRPNAFRMVPFAPPPPKRSETSRRLSVATALRVCRPPQAVGVMFTGSMPARVFWDGQRYAVREIAGPWRVSGQWWSEANWCREEWDVRLDDARAQSVSAASPSIRARAAGMCRGRMTEYVELHARSAFSFLEGASMPEALMQQSRRAGDASDGAARSQRRLRCAALSHGGQRDEGAGAYRRGDRRKRSGTNGYGQHRTCRISIRLNLCGCRCWPNHAPATRTSAA